MTQIENYDQVDVFVRLDVGRGEHHAVALDRRGRKLYDRLSRADSAPVPVSVASA